MADERLERDAPSSAAESRATRARGKQTVRRLLQAGRDALDDVGFADLRVDDVVRHAGTSHGTFYLYFQDKRDLLDALGTDLAEELAAVADALPTLDARPETRALLETWLADVLRVLRTKSGVVRALMSADPHWDWRSLTSTLEASVARRLDAANGAAPGVPSEHAAWAFAAMAVGLGTGAPTDAATQASIAGLMHRGLVVTAD